MLIGHKWDIYVDFKKIGKTFFTVPFTPSVRVFEITFLKDYSTRKNFHDFYIFGKFMKNGAFFVFTALSESF